MRVREEEREQEINLESESFSIQARVRSFFPHFWEIKRNHLSLEEDKSKHDFSSREEEEKIMYERRGFEAQEKVSSAAENSFPIPVRHFCSFLYSRRQALKKKKGSFVLTLLIG